jgi:hypothetical protein
MTDAQRLRLLFVVTGSGLGAMGGASLVVLLGSLWSVPSAVALVASIGGAVCSASSGRRRIDSV